MLHNCFCLQKGMTEDTEDAATGHYYCMCKHCSKWRRLAANLQSLCGPQIRQKVLTYLPLKYSPSVWQMYSNCVAQLDNI